MNGEGGCGLGLVVAGLPAGFFEEADVFDDDGFGEGFAHVVDGEGRAGGGGECLHLDAGFGVGDGGGKNLDADLVNGSYVDGAFGEGQGVAERDQVAGVFGCLDAGEDSGVEHGAFFAMQFFAVELGHDLGGELHDGAGGGAAASDGFVGDVDHVRLVVFVEVGEWFHRSLRFWI